MADGIRAILFDLDGTLHDSAACIVECFLLACREHGLPEPARTWVRGTMGIPLERSIPSHAGSLGVSLTNEQLRAMIATYRAHYARLTPEMVRPFPGVEPMLDQLASRTIPMAIVTSKRLAPAEMNLRHTGLLRHFPVIVGSDMVLRYKPEPDTVLLAAEKLGLHDLSRALVVGDATFDILMGRAAGARTCAATWGAHDRTELLATRPDFVVESPSDLARLVGAS